MGGGGATLPELNEWTLLYRWQTLHGQFNTTDLRTFSSLGRSYMHKKITVIFHSNK